MLRHQLEITQPGVTSQVHLLAARWYAAEGDALAALTHAAAAGDWELVARLVVDHGLPLAASMDRAELFRIVRSVPADRLIGSAELFVCAAILPWADGRYQAIPQYIAHARRMIGGHRDDGLEVALSVLELAVARRCGAMFRVVAAATELLAELAGSSSTKCPP